MRAVRSLDIAIVALGGLVLRASYPGSADRERTLLVFGSRVHPGAAYNTCTFSPSSSLLSAALAACQLHISIHQIAMDPPDGRQLKPALLPYHGRSAQRCLQLLDFDLELRATPIV